MTLHKFTKSSPPLDVLCRFFEKFFDVQDGDNEVQAALLKLDQFLRFRSILCVLFQATESYKMTIETNFEKFW